MRLTLGTDGAVRTPTSDAPEYFLPDGSGFRVLFRFIDQTERLPSYGGLRAAKTDYAQVRTDYTTYRDLLYDKALGIDYEADVTRFVNGVTVSRGRNSMLDPVDSGTATVGLVDRLGLFDPRATDTAFGPGRRIRTGIWTRVEVMAGGVGGTWEPLFTGLTDSWKRDVTPEEDPTVTVEAADFFEGLSAAWIGWMTVKEKSGARVNRILDKVWKQQWGSRNVAAGTATIDPDIIEENSESDFALEAMRRAADLEDGQFFIARDGSATFWDYHFRESRAPVAQLLGRGAEDFSRTTHLCTYGEVRSTYASYQAVLDGNAEYRDLMLCSGPAAPGSLASACLVSFVVGDTVEDLVNRVRLEGGRIEQSAPSVQVSNSDSIARFGLVERSRSDLATRDVGQLQWLAARLVHRWSSGEARITGAALNLVLEKGATAELLTLDSGDLVQIIDKLPQAIGDRFEIRNYEVLRTDWTLGPDAFSLALTTDRDTTEEPDVPLTLGSGVHGNQGDLGPYVAAPAPFGGPAPPPPVPATYGGI